MKAVPVDAQVRTVSFCHALLVFKKNKEINILQTKQSSAGQNNKGYRLVDELASTAETLGLWNQQNTGIFYVESDAVHSFQITSQPWSFFSK